MCLRRFRGWLAPSVDLGAIHGHGQFCAFFDRTLKGIEHGNEAVVVACGKRLELVVVTACATDGEAEKGLPGGADDIVELVIAVCGTIRRFVVPMTCLLYTSRCV